MSTATSSNWNLLAVRTAEDVDGRLYPLIGSGETAVEPEPRDGAMQAFRGNGITVTAHSNDGVTRLAHLKDTLVEVIVTDTRTVMVCERWNKGARYRGIGLGATAAGIQNVVNSVREARARRGSLLLGHIRHNWLEAIACADAPNRWRGGVLRMVCEDGYTESRRGLIIEIVMPNGKSGVPIADLITSKVAAFWLTQPDDMKPETRTALVDMVAIRNPFQPAPKGKVESRKLPIYQRVNQNTVRAE